MCTHVRIHIHTHAHTHMHACTHACAPPPRFCSTRTNVKPSQGAKFTGEVQLAGVCCHTNRNKSPQSPCGSSMKPTRHTAVSPQSAPRPAGSGAGGGSLSLSTDFVFIAFAVLLPIPLPQPPSSLWIMGSHISSLSLLLRPSRDFRNLPTHNRVMVLSTVKCLLWQEGLRPVFSASC